MTNRQLWEGLMMQDPNAEKAKEPRLNLGWYAQLTPRQQQEVDFARTYRDEFAHGTDGHNRLILIAELSDIIDKLTAARG